MDFIIALFHLHACNFLFLSHLLRFCLTWVDAAGKFNVSGMLEVLGDLGSSASKGNKVVLG